MCCVMIGAINLSCHDHFLQELNWQCGHSVRKSRELHALRRTVFASSTLINKEFLQVAALAM